MHTLLLIEDDKSLREMLRDSLESSSFAILEASLGSRSIEIAQSHNVDAILLDINLPDTSGMELIGQLRRYSDAPLIVISGQGATALKVESLSLGADDYVQKPFDIDELMARLHAHIRRAGRQALPVQPASIGSSAYLQFDRWVLDRARYQLYDQAHNPIDLTTREFQLLEALLMNPQRTLRRRDLCEVIREDRYVPTPRAIDVKITRIRKKIGDSAVAPRIIKTVRGVGYAIECDIHPVNQMPDTR